MEMIKTCIAVFALLASALPACAEDPQLICFGSEPSWGLEFSGRSSARLLLPDQRPVYFRGSETRLDALKESAWRGKAAGGKGGSVQGAVHKNGAQSLLEGEGSVDTLQTLRSLKPRR